MIRVKFCYIVVMGMIPGFVCVSAVCRRVAGGFRVGFGGFGSRGLMIRRRSLMGKQKKNG
jgi:hypothetical protein